MKIKSAFQEEYEKTPTEYPSLFHTVVEARRLLRKRLKRRAVFFSFLFYFLGLITGLLI